ncbi:hypothetical protein T265_01807 [Opisthorchis viverrini]|uniref:Uncharacterized protein n=1 Tax=Opisthorchis viverrini TaxID=6198 RepID=A0A075AIQ2_OPIVI|nr:hypothetical protein T265_01807 [Opisthorchis viverrini]KER32029.1 hypothetical protein T265_01807 [Opisthorchis viverrini]
MMMRPSNGLSDEKPSQPQKQLPPNRNIKLNGAGINQSTTTPLPSECWVTEDTETYPPATSTTLWVRFLNEAQAEVSQISSTYGHGDTSEKFAQGELSACVDRVRVSDDKPTEELETKTDLHLWDVFFSSSATAMKVEPLG